MSEANNTRKIKALPESVWTQIAAGEVVERPASAVKELIENALDADARKIIVRLRDGGRLSIIVEDDGCGIALDDLPLALAPHATSKLGAIDDLEKLHTLGYRGEALASLMAVAKIEIRSRPAHETGGMIRAQDGQVTDCIQASCALGTRVQVNNIFEQFPARRKFLKSARSELSRVASCIREYAVARPDVRFVLENDNREYLATDGLGDRIRTLARFWGAEREIQHVVSKAGGLSLDCWWQGHGSGPSARGKHDIMTFVNGRAVNDSTVKSAVSIVGRELVGNWALFFTLDPALVDVNIHPTKAEVRFRNEDEIFRGMHIAVSKLGAPTNVPIIPGNQVKQVNQENQAGRVSKNNPANPAPTTAPTSAPASTPERGWNFATATRSSRPVYPAKSKFARITPPMPVSKSSQSLSALSEKANTSTTVLDSKHANALAFDLDIEPETERATIGNNNNTHDSKDKAVLYMGQMSTGYLVFDDNGTLMLMDPHAAHERVKYEQIKRATGVNTGSDTASQGLLVPMLLPPTLSLEALAYREKLDLAGFTLEERDGGVWLKSMPALPDIASSPEALLRISIAALKTGQDGDVREILWRTWATMACKAAVKLTTELSHAEACSLQQELMACEQPFYCPHGRPTLLKLDAKDLLRYFEREGRTSNETSALGL